MKKEFILNEEVIKNYERPALERIATLSNGYMRMAITLLDKCISYGDITLSNVEKVLDLISYDDLFNIADALKDKDYTKASQVISKLKANSYPILNSLLDFFINCEIFRKTNEITFTNIPEIYKDRINQQDYMNYVDRLFKYRQLMLVEEENTLVDLFLLEMCRS